MFISQIDIDNN